MQGEYGREGNNLKSIMRWFLGVGTVRDGILQGQDAVVGAGKFALELLDFLPLAIDHVAEVIDRLFLLGKLDFEVGEALV